MSTKRTEKPRKAGLPALRVIREQRGIDQAALAERMGVARQQVSRWERGETSPNVWDALQIACILGVTVEELTRQQPTAEDRAWLAAGLEDMARGLAEIEANVPPEQLRAWLAKMDEVAKPIQWDDERGEFVEVPR